MANSETLNRTEEVYAPERLVLPSLFLARFAMQSGGIIVVLLLIEIGNTFNTPVGMTGQLASVALFVSTITTLFMGAWSVRFRHKSLLLLGLVLLGTSTLGAYFAPTFLIMILSYSLIAGIGDAMIGPMTYSLVAPHFPLERRANAIAWVSAAAPFAFLIGPVVISVLAGMGGWRWAFLGYAFPLIIISFVVVLNGLASPEQSVPSMMSTTDYFKGFKRIFTNRSATACLLGCILILAAGQAGQTYGISYFRERFPVSVELATILLTIMGLVVFVGALSGGKVVNWLGRKPATVLMTIFLSIGIIAFMNVPTFWLSFVVVLFASLVFGILYTTTASLALEQVPEFRGTMMSLNHGSLFLGQAVGTALGGALLLQYDYGMLGLGLGVLGLVATLVYYLWVIDPTHDNSD